MGVVFLCHAVQMPIAGPSTAGNEVVSKLGQARAHATVGGFIATYGAGRDSATGIYRYCKPTQEKKLTCFGNLTLHQIIATNPSLASCLISLPGLQLTTQPHPILACPLAIPSCPQRTCCSRSAANVMASLLPVRTFLPWRPNLPCTSDRAGRHRYARKPVLCRWWVTPCCVPGPPTRCGLSAKTRQHRRAICSAMRATLPLVPGLLLCSSAGIIVPTAGRHRSSLAAVPAKLATFCRKSWAAGLARHSLLLLLLLLAGGPAPF